MIHKILLLGVILILIFIAPWAFIGKVIFALVIMFILCFCAIMIGALIKGFIDDRRKT